MRFLSILAKGKEYLARTYLMPKWSPFQINIHHFVGSDDEVMHDHPWHSVSFCLKGEMREHTVSGVGTIKRGSIVFRKAQNAHRLELVSQDAYTLFITGPRFRDWGFHCPNGWVLWSDFINKQNGSSVRKAGCE